MMNGEDSNDSELRCQVCSDPASQAPNEIVICDRCNRGFHQRCHSPTIPSEVLIPDISWVCKKCFYDMSTEEREDFNIITKVDDLIATDSKSSGSSNGVGKNAKPKIHTKLPYDLKKLNWDDKHITNEEDIYCYCGEGLNYCRSLLQCFTCKQWFHITCIEKIDFDLLIGDQYFKFMCSVCNDGEEIYQRITMKWTVVVGLTLSNLTYGSDRRIFNINTDIIPYMIENEDKFKLNLPLDRWTKEKLIQKIDGILKENPDKFICENGDWRLNVDFPYNDPLTYSPYHENLVSTFAIQKNSSANRTSSADNHKKGKLPDGACRKNASAQPIKVNKFNKFKNMTKRRHSTDNTNLNDSSKTKRSKPNSLLKGKYETSSKSKKSSSYDTEFNYFDDKNLLDLDTIIPYPKSFDGKNNPFYRSPDKTSPANNAKTENPQPATTVNSTSTCNSQKKTATGDKVEYRVVNNEPNKLVLTRVNSMNENSYSPLNNGNRNGQNKLNGTLKPVHKGDVNEDDHGIIKILGKRSTTKGGVEYMLERKDID